MSEQGTISFYDRALGHISRTFREVAGSARVALTRSVRPDLPEDDAARLAKRIDLALTGRGGEVSARARAADLGRVYLSLSPIGRRRFLTLLAERHGVDRDRLGQAVATWRDAGDVPALVQAEAELRAALEPPRRALLKHFNGLTEGVKFLVDMRADLLVMSKGDAVLRGLSEDLRGLLAGWFDIGFLDLSRITWNSPASLLEKLIDYEAVHEIRSWRGLKKRLDSDRRCFAFFHPRMPDEPLIFVEVALVDGMAASVQTLLDETMPAADPTHADAAIFYSISNCQKGLAGVSFGDFLIKRVVDVLAKDFPALKIFSTLSPIPGFRGWLEERVAADDPGLLSAAENDALAPFGADTDGGARLLALLDRPNWPAEEALAAALQAPLLRLCARYLVQEKNRRGGARDRVANFHLSNGARIERINWLGDVSSKGLQQSAGMMVNYRYKLDNIEANHEAYKGEGVVPVHTAVKRLLKA